MRTGPLALSLLMTAIGLAACSGDGSDPSDTASVNDLTDSSWTSSLVVINEVAAKGDPDDWFELYNTSDAEVDVSGYQYSDDLAEGPRATLPEGSVIAAKGFLQVMCSDETAGFKLGKDEELGFYDPSGALLDSVDWNEGDSPEGQSYGRVPDGTGGFTVLDVPSPKASNSQ